mgnify:CR=1 FL=1
MKKIFIVIVLGIVFSASLTAQSSSRYTEDRNVGKFHSVRATLGMDVIVIQSPKNSVTVDVYDPGYIDKVETYVERGVLHVKYAFKVNQSINGRNVVYVYSPDIREISAGTGATVKIDGTLEGDHLKLTAGTGSDIYGKIRYTSVDITSKLGSDIKLEGKAGVCVATATGGSDIDLKNLKCNEITATAKGGSDIDVYATDRVDLRSSGGSDITYYGDPKIRNINSSASSDISRGRTKN